MKHQLGECLAAQDLLKVLMSEKGSYQGTSRSTCAGRKVHKFHQVIPKMLANACVLCHVNASQGGWWWKLVIKLNSFTRLTIDRTSSDRSAGVTVKQAGSINLFIFM